MKIHPMKLIFIEKILVGSLLETYQAVESCRWVYYRFDLAFSGHLVVLSVFDPSIGMVQEILKYQFAKHPLKYRLVLVNFEK